MKNYYKFSHNDKILYADRADLEEELQKYRSLLECYYDLEEENDTPAYIARGNGFCDAKYSDDFIEGQIEQIKITIAQLEQWLSEIS